MRIVIVATIDVVDKYVAEDIESTLNLVLPYMGDNATIDVREDD